MVISIIIVPLLLRATVWADFSTFLTTVNQWIYTIIFGQIFKPTFEETIPLVNLLSSPTILKKIDCNLLDKVTLSLFIAYTACGVMFTGRPCPPFTLFYTFVLGKRPIFKFINKFIISNFVLHNPVHKLTHECTFLDEITCPADMGGQRTSPHN